MNTIKHYTGTPALAERIDIYYTEEAYLSLFVDDIDAILKAWILTHEQDIANAMVFLYKERPDDIRSDVSRSF